MLAITFSFANAARAQFIIDTGPGSSNPIGFAVQGPDSPFGPLGTSSLAGEFTLNQSATISSVQGWIDTTPGWFDVPEPLHASIYSNVTNPYAGTGPGELLDTAGFNLPPCLSPAQADCLPSWNGPSDLGWKLPAGTYWIVFQGIDGDTGAGEMPSGPLAPLANYEFLGGGNQFWSELAAPIGVRIAGTLTTSVPEPDTFGLFVCGLARLLVLCARRNTLDSSLSAARRTARSMT